MREIGTVIEFDGKVNNLLYDEKVYQLPIGSLICEYARFKPTKLKGILTKYENKNDKLSINSIARSLEYIIKETNIEFGPVISSMIMTEFFNALNDLIENEDCIIKKEFNELNDLSKDDQMRKFILDNSGTNIFTYDTIGNALNYAYYCFSLNFCIFVDIFQNTMKCNRENELTNDTKFKRKINSIISLYFENSDYQSIDYKIMNLEGRLASIYTIRNSVSLFLFELAHVLETDAIIKKCKNCGNYFVPQTRIDSIYCNYRSPQNPNKLCKEIGAQITRIKKENEDEFTKEYRKQYMRLKMKCRRHLNDSSYSKALKKLVSEAQMWRERIKEEEVSIDEWKTWLNQYSNVKSLENK